MPTPVLIIENHPDSRKLMSYLLQKSGYEVQVAGTGEEGVELALRDKFDLILCDIHMGSMDGYAVARRLRSEPRYLRIPLVAITAMSWADSRDKVLAAGFDGHISKAIAPKVFIQQVHGFVSGEGILSSAGSRLSAENQ